jgi:hypothetical protein
MPEGSRPNPESGEEERPPSTHPGPGRRRLLPVLFLAFSVLSLSASFLGEGRTFGGHDLVAFFAPHGERARTTFERTGEFPVWDPYQYAGTPAVGNLQTELFYPPNLIVLFLPAPLAFHLLFTFHLALAAAGMYRLARSLPAGRTAATLAGLCYALSLTLTSRVAAGHYSPLVPLAQAPLLVFLLRRSIGDPRWNRSLLLGVYGGMVLLSGHPQFLLQLGCLSAAFAAVEIVRIRKERQTWIRGLGMSAAALILSLLIASPLLLPAMEVRSHAVRGHAEANEVYAEVPPDYAFLPRDGVSFVVPLIPRSRYIQGDRWSGFWHEKAVYIGILPLELALYAVLSGPRRPWTRILGGLTLVAMLDAAARHLPAHRLFEFLIPGYASFRVPCRSIWVATFALCLLVPLGWDRWTTGVGSDRLRRWFPTAMIVSALSISVLLYLRFSAGGEVLLFCGIAALSAAILHSTRSHARWGAIAAGVLTLLELWGQARSVIPGVPAGSRSAPPWYLSALGNAPSEYRLLDPRNALDYRPGVHDVRMMHGYGYPLLSRTHRLYSSAWETPVPPDFNTLGGGKTVARPEILDQLNVGWLVWEGAPPESGLIEAARQGSRVLYRRPSARPQLFTGSGPVPFTRRHNSVDAKVSHDTAEELVFSESWMPGWRAEIDGVPVEVHPWKDSLMSVPVPPGEHQIRFSYRPRPLWIGLWISALTLGAAASGGAGLLLFSRLRRSSAGRS